MSQESLSIRRAYGNVVSPLNVASKDDAESDDDLDEKKPAKKFPTFQSAFVKVNGKAYVHDKHNACLQQADRACLDLSTDSETIDEEMSVVCDDLFDSPIPIVLPRQPVVIINPNGKNIQIVGLSLPTEGRSCIYHRFCGDSVQIGDVLRLVGSSVTIRCEEEEAIKLFKGGCFVGYIPRMLIHRDHVQSSIGGYCQVTERYGDNDNVIKKDLDLKNFGMASAQLM